ncbi:hypothetical protein NMY3_03499 [Candidatus Nitrosocosmicus oleophilus]|uniref:PsbP C-terminal domain-containing protein n=1 Tax=Candidatus Nitrosocosmicus oleophilus TaxID=1353260 RepID=A0A654M4V3_9ARCH|nr:PsbP-related protein [Candidatus Nitrosocosmicus oleophilus]ALI37681.1 hypothetical protein NMY3_03499 [Candidatus Nitrosocosmicus oleophilus]
MVIKSSTLSISISVSVSFIIIMIFVLSLTNGENKFWNISALTETPEFDLTTQDNNSNIKNITKENNFSLSLPSVSYSNSTYGIKIDYPSDWTIKEGGAATIFHNQSKSLNVVAEILAPIQSDYYNPKIGASHNSIRLVVEDYDTFGDFTNNNIFKYMEKNDPEADNKNKLLTVATKRIGAIGIYCHNFDLKSWNQNATLAGNPAHQIFLDYSYDKNSKDATEIWTIKDDKIYIIEFVAQDKYYELYLPVVNEIINSFQITNSTSKG